MLITGSLMGVALAIQNSKAITKNLQQTFIGALFYNGPSEPPFPRARAGTPDLQSSSPPEYPSPPSSLIERISSNIGLDERTARLRRNLSDLSE